jgi:uncharacterized membrane protein YuzA (DUF378 family)
MKDTRSIWRTVDAIAYALIIIGALNWGLVGFFAFDLVAALFGEMTVLSRIIYALVGVAAVYHLLSLPAILRRWATAARAAPAREREREHAHV